MTGIEAMAREALERHAKATPPPWFRPEPGDEGFCDHELRCYVSAIKERTLLTANPHFVSAADLDFIAFARTALPALAQEVLRLRKIVDEFERQRAIREYDAPPIGAPVHNWPDTGCGG